MEEFVADRGSTFKTREPHQWPDWREKVMCIIRGFGSKSAEEKELAELEMTEIVRRCLTRARKSMDNKRERDEDEDSIEKRSVTRQVRALFANGGCRARVSTDDGHISPPDGH
jgi:hypothetical protein